MSLYKALSLVAVSGLLAISASPVYAKGYNPQFSMSHDQSIVDLERDQFGNSASPDVDPAASRGPDKSIVRQQRDQFGNSASPIVDPVSSKGGESIVQLQLQQIPGGS